MTQLTSTLGCGLYQRRSMFFQPNLMNNSFIMIPILIVPFEGKGDDDKFDINIKDIEHTHTHTHTYTIPTITSNIININNPPPLFTHFIHSFTLTLGCVINDLKIEKLNAEGDLVQNSKPDPFDYSGVVDILKYLKEKKEQRIPNLFVTIHMFPFSKK